MNKINWSGITAEAATNVVILIVALINAILQMFGINTLPIENDEISAVVSGVFLVVMTLWNTWKNRNISKASQIGQQITDAIKHGELVAEDVQEIIAKFQK